MPQFKVVSDYKLMGDQPQAVDKIASGILQGKRAQTNNSRWIYIICDLNPNDNMK